MSLPYDPDSWPANWILQLIAKDQLGDFYNSKQWKRFRLKLLKSKPCRCQLCEQTGTGSEDGYSTASG